MDETKTSALRETEMDETKTRAMHETEAREFIAKEVSRLLWMRLAGFATLFGIANIAALIGLWYSVTSQAGLIARSRATEVANDEAHRAVKGASQTIEAITRVAEARVMRLDESGSALSEKLGSSTNDLVRLEASYKNLESELQKIEGTIKAATADATHQFAEAAAQFAALPDDQRANIMKAVNVSGARLQSAEESLAKLKSDLGSFRREFAIGNILHQSTYDGMVKQQLKPNESRPVADLAVSLNASGSRPVLVSLTHGYIGLDTDPGGPVLVYVRVMRVANGKKSMVDSVRCEARGGGVSLPASAFQVIDRGAPAGRCVYSLEVDNKGTGLFYLSPGVQIAAWEL